VTGQEERGRKTSAGAQSGAQRAKKSEQARKAGTGAEAPAARQRSRATGAPTGAATNPRATNLVPQVRANERTPVSNPRTRNTAAPRLTNIPRLTSDTADTGHTGTGATASVPRPTNGVLKTASAAPSAPNAPTKKTGTPAGASSSRMRKTAPPETIILPALSETPDAHNPSDAHDDPASSSGQIRRRRTSTARPVRPEDTELVARQTKILSALEVVIEDVRVATEQAPVVREPNDMVVVDADPEPHVPVTIVPAGALAPTPIWLQPSRRGNRSLVAGFVICLITLGLVLGVLLENNPLGVAPGGISPLGLLGAHNASNTAAGDPTGPWDTQAGAVLGLGGGAGPGVKAPGSAGLPTGNTSGGNPPATGNPPPATNTGISPAPLQPWPPRWAYMYVPGHPAFRMTLPANGYYYWAFGQCTWWAQYKRQDENLRHMGNARYWAAGAAARGYTVGRTPRAGATVVFQPGIEGAGGAGHVAHVEKVYPGGWFLISEMNFYWNGGGWGRVDYRFAYARSGVSFIY
jgi:CHAP domain-containing protein